MKKMKFFTSMYGEKIADYNQVTFHRKRGVELERHPKKQSSGEAKWDINTDQISVAKLRWPQYSFSLNAWSFKIAFFYSLSATLSSSAIIKIRWWFILLCTKRCYIAFSQITVDGGLNKGWEKRIEFWLCFRCADCLLKKWIKWLRESMWGVTDHF